MSDTDSETEVIAIDNNLNLSDLDTSQILDQINYFRQKPNIIKESKLSLNNPSKVLSMTTTTDASTPLPKDEIQMLLHAIPEYSPGQNLSIFINEVDNLFTHLNTRLSPDLHYLVNFSIRSKIKGDARNFIAYQNATEWPLIRQSLLQKYGDQRSEELLVSALMQCVQQKNETYMDYYSKLLKAFNDLMQYVSLNITDANYLGYKKPSITG